MANWIVFDAEVATQSGFGLAAARSMEEARAKGRGSTADFFRHAQSFLSAVANLSKLFWPGPDGDAGRGAMLRSKYGVPQELPPSWRKVRNSYEHFDERLDTWAKEDRGLSDMWIGEGPIQVSGGAKAQLRNYDTRTDELTFWESSLNVPETVAELRRLHSEAQKAVAESLFRR